MNNVKLITEKMIVLLTNLLEKHGYGFNIEDIKKMTLEEASDAIFELQKSEDLSDKQSEVLDKILEENPGLVEYVEKYGRNVATYKVVLSKSRKNPLKMFTKK